MLILLENLLMFNYLVKKLYLIVLKIYFKDMKKMKKLTQKIII